MRKGLLRLWVVTSVIGVPVASEMQFNSLANSWEEIDANGIRICGDSEAIAASSQRPYSQAECFRSVGVYNDKNEAQTAFMHEHTTPGAYWLESLTLFFLIDLVLTALMIGTFLVARWVFRGFSSADA